jgi:flagellar protein FliS
MTTATAMRNAYAKESVSTASPAKLLTMLYDRLIRDLLTAEQALGAGDAEKASEQLLHAQAIVLELQSSLKVDAWDGGPGLSALYAFVYGELVAANLSKDAAKVRSCHELLEPLRQAWHEAARLVVVQGGQ